MALKPNIGQEKSYLPSAREGDWLFTGQGGGMIISLILQRLSPLLRARR